MSTTCGGQVRGRWDEVEAGMSLAGDEIGSACGWLSFCWGGSIILSIGSCTEAFCTIVMETHI